MVLPLPGSLWHWGGLPPGFGIFPPERLMAAAPFSLPYFIFGCSVAVAILAFLIRPTLFGFRPGKPGAPVAGAAKPWWFYAGFTGAAAWLWVMYFGPPALATWSFVPTWWFFIFGLDGWSYARNGGRSLMTERAKEFWVLTALSVPGWLLFDYLSFFVPGHWSYPFQSLQTRWVSVLWFLATYTTIWPAIAEWYTILESFPALKAHWSDGPKLAPSRRTQWQVLALGAVCCALYGTEPDALFFMLWVGPLLVLSSVLTLQGAWTPFRPITQGNWSPMILVALAALATYLLGEHWNWGSEYFRGHQPANPNYWVYEIPYLNAGHLFSEMPVLGYFGYLPFGVFCWVWWALCVRLFDLGWSADFSVPMPRNVPTVEIEPEEGVSLEPRAVRLG
jgi:hypothetical protein